MKKILLIILFYSSIFIYADNLSGRRYNSKFEVIIFGKEEFVHSGIEPETGKKFEYKYPYKLIVKNKIPFLKFGKNYEKEWLILYSEDLILIYDKERSYPFFMGISDNPRKLEGLYFSSDYFTATSFLTEGKREYLPGNLGIEKLSTPWVEGVKGNGIGEKILINSLGANSFFLSNGYVSMDKPYLYEMNSRVKRLRITDKTNNISKLIELEDTPNPQWVFMPDYSKEVELEILEVYEGTKWQDTCINFIVIRAF